jgi:hypothetical protein
MILPLRTKILLNPVQKFLKMRRLSRQAYSELHVIVRFAPFEGPHQQ